MSYSCCVKGSLCEAFLNFIFFSTFWALSPMRAKTNNGAHSSAVFAPGLSINGKSNSFKWSLVLNHWLSSSITAHLCLLWGLFCNWSSLRQGLISGLWLAGGRCRHWQCMCVWIGFHPVRTDSPVRKSAERHRGASPPMSPIPAGLMFPAGPPLRAAWFSAVLCDFFAMSCLDVMYQVFGPQPYFSSYSPYHHQVRPRSCANQVKLPSRNISDTFVWGSRCHFGYSSGGDAVSLY